MSDTDVSRLKHVQYPKMERQDLTQSQLGSFKFVPTDPDSATIQYHIPHWSVSNAQLHEKQISSIGTHSEHPGGHNSAGITTAADFASLRLQQGPAAIRAAVDSGRASPGRKSRYAADNLQPLAPTFVPRDFRDGSETSVPALRAPLSLSAVEMGPENFVLQQTSLIRALTAEQDAHALTKAELGKERERRDAKDIEIQHLTDHNRSLIGTVNMLKSLVQHNMKKEEERENSAGRNQTSNTVVARPTDRGRIPVSSQPRLHEILEIPAQVHKERLYETARYGAFSRLARENIDMLDNQPISPDTCPIECSKINDDVCKPDYELIDLRSEKGREDIAGSIEHITPDINAEHSESAVPSTLPSPVKSLLTGETQNTNTVKDMDTTKNSTRMDMPDLESSATSAKEIITIPKTGEPQSAVDSTGENLMVMPFDPHIHWTTTAQNPIFENDQDKRNRLGPRNASSNSRTPFWEHSVRYMPNKALNNLYRTVMIDFIPLEARHHDVLGQIRGGALESVRMYGPVTGAANFQTARLVFNYELGAQTVYRRGQNPGVFVCGKRVRVWQVLEPTYPRTEQLEDDIFENGYTRILIMECSDPHKHRDVVDALPNMVATKSILEIEHRPRQGFYLLKFASVTDAINAMDILVNDERFEGCNFDYEEDDCAEPYE